MAQVINDNLDLRSNKPIDNRYLKNGAPYANVNDVNTTININYRYPGLPVLVIGGEYWYKDGVEDINLVPKDAGSVTNIQKQIGSTGESYTLLPEDNNTLFFVTSGTPFNVIVPDNLAANFEARFINSGAGTITFVNSNGVLFVAPTGPSINYQEYLELIKIADSSTFYLRKVVPATVSVPAGVPMVFSTVVTAGTTFTLPIDIDSVVTIDWGDLSPIVEYAGNAADLAHTYAVDGEYNIKITGELNVLNFDGSASASYVKQLKSWGDAAPTLLSFKGCTELTADFISSGWGDASILNLSNMTSTDSMFEGCTSLITVDNIQFWNMSTILSTSKMFLGCVKYNQNLEGWESNGVGTTSNIQNFSQMFDGCADFNGDVEMWNVSGSTNMFAMFRDCLKITRAVNDWGLEVGNVTTFESMFENCKLFNKDMYRWRMTSAINLERMFYNATSYNFDLSQWTLPIVESMAGFMDSSPLVEGGPKALMSFSHENLTAFYTSLATQFLSNTGTQSNVVADFNTIKYTSEGQISRDILTEDAVWVITDAGEAIPQVGRSDDPTLYLDVNLAVQAIIADYTVDGIAKLTQDVTVTVNSALEIKTPGRGVHRIFHMLIAEFNNNSDYFLTIDGMNNLTIDGNTVGAFKLNNCSNIRFTNIAFKNIGSNAVNPAPEQTCAVYAQGTTEHICKNILVDNCTVDGYYLDGITTKYGHYAFIFKYIENVTLANIVITRFDAALITTVAVDSVNLSNVQIFDNIAVAGIISQPCYLNVSNAEIIHVNDCLFDISNFDTGIIGSGLKRIILERSTFENAKGEAIRLEGIVDIELFSIESCIFQRNVQSQPYPWIKQVIAFGTCKKLDIINNTMHLSPAGNNSGGEFWTRFFRGTYVQELLFINNIFILEATGSAFTDNSAGMSIFNITSMGTYKAGYNIYQDSVYPIDPTAAELVYRIRNTIINSQYEGTGSESFTVYALESLATSSYTNNADGENSSSLIDLSIDLFTLKNYLLPTAVVADHQAFQLLFILPKYDINKNSPVTYNLGAYQTNTTIPVQDDVISYKGIDTFTLEGIEFDPTALHSPYSETVLLMIPDENISNGVYKWEFSNAGSTIISNYIGNSIAVRLSSELDVNGAHVATVLYDVTITKI